MHRAMNKVLGVACAYDERYRGLSETRGFWIFKKIVFGPAFTRLTPREKQAVLLHEAGHAKMNHAEKRILPMAWACVTHPVMLFRVLAARDEQIAKLEWDRFLSSSGMDRFAQSQEYQADNFAAQCGYGADLAQVFLRFGSSGNLHPSLQSRIERLFRMEGV